MKRLNIKQTILIATVMSALFASAKGTLSRKEMKSWGETYYEYTVVRVDTLQEATFNDPMFEYILDNDIIPTMYEAKVSQDKMLFVTAIDGNIDSLLVSEKHYLRERGAKFNFTGFMKCRWKTIVIQKEVCDAYCTMLDKTITEVYKYSWNTKPKVYDPIYWEIAIHDDNYHLCGPIIQYVQEKTYNRLENRGQNEKQRKKSTNQTN